MYVVFAGIIVIVGLLVKVSVKASSLQIISVCAGTTGFGLTIILYYEEPPGQAAAQPVDATAE